MVAAIEFYSILPDVRIIQRSDDLSQLYTGPNRISLKRVEPDSTSLQSDGCNRVRARHFGFAVASAAEVERIGSILRERNYQLITEVTERLDAHAIFCCDPSGNQIEIYYDRLIQALESMASYPPIPSC